MIQASHILLPVFTITYTWLTCISNAQAQQPPPKKAAAYEVNPHIAQSIPPAPAAPPQQPASPPLVLRCNPVGEWNSYSAQVYTIWTNDNTCASADGNRFACWVGDVEIRWGEEYDTRYVIDRISGEMKMIMPGGGYWQFQCVSAASRQF
jgi:hypothetical protein